MWNNFQKNPIFYSKLARWSSTEQMNLAEVACTFWILPNKKRIGWSMRLKKNLIPVSWTRHWIAHISFEICALICNRGDGFSMEFHIIQRFLARFWLYSINKNAKNIISNGYGTYEKSNSWLVNSTLNFTP